MSCIAFAVLLPLGLASRPASADTVYTLNTNGCSSGFVVNSNGFFFASDVVGIDQAAGYGLTGNIGTNTITTTPIVPEPASLLLFGTGLTAIGGLFRRKMAGATNL